MAVRVKVSKKHQIVVPSAVRKQLGIKSGGELLVELRGGYAVMLPEPQEYVRQEREAWQT
jgi:AbrB family looped-hinge helix DNA binding protein